MNEIILAGCAPVPLASYLKALGVLRLLSRKDPGLRAAWRGEGFALSTALAEEALKDYLLSEYVPTPVVAPWNGGSGFFAKDNKTAIEVIRASPCQRLAAYREALAAADDALVGFSREESPKGDDKDQLLARARGKLPDAALEWFDASVLLAGGSPQYPPLLGTGGNDGRLDFTNNFMQRLTEVLGLGEQTAPVHARLWLDMALFAATAPGLVKRAVGQFAPGQAGGPNAGAGFEADGAINPWDFILMIEGALVFAAAASRRNADDPFGTLSYPFTVRAVGAGAGSLGEGDTGRGELWMPLWHQPASYAEVRALLAEGRVALGKKPARDALDFVRAVHHLGGYRGVRSFQRFGLLKRNGDAHFATPLARVVARDEPSGNLLDELDNHGWLDAFRRFARGDNTPHRFLRLRRQLEDRLFDLSGRVPTKPEAQSLLTLLGVIQNALAISVKAREAVAPVPRLSERWVVAADDGMPEFRIAAALAGLSGVGEVALPMRAQLFPVQRRFNQWVTPDAGEPVRIHIPLAGRLSAMLGAWLQRRLWLMQKLGMSDRPLSSPAAALLDDVTAFLQDDGMDARVAALMHGLSLCDIPPDTAPTSEAGTLPAAFGLMKLALTPERDFRRLGRLREGEHLPLPTGMLSALAAGNPDNRAVTLAWRRLRATGLTPRLGSALPTLVGIDPARAAAALLIPLRGSATAMLARNLLEDAERETAPIGTT